MKSSLHIKEAIDHVTREIGNKVTHDLWSSECYVYSTPSGNFRKVTSDGEEYFDWLRVKLPKMGWRIVP